MKKIIAAGLLALGIMLASRQEASAWTKFSLSAGITLNYEGGNNNFCNGLFRSGQVPGYPTDVYMGGIGAPCYGFDGVYTYGYGFDGGAPVATANQGYAPQAAPAQAARPQGTTQAVYYPQGGAGYPTANYGYGSYGYSYGGYGNQQVPSYWYGR